MEKKPLIEYNCLAMNILDDLNSEQKEAVLATEGPVLILAGAGSGKTKSLTNRVAYLIAEKKVSPYEILAITFTNKAAQEMKERMAKLLGYEKELGFLPWMGTFHSVCVKLLRREAKNLGFNSSFTIYDSDDSLAVVKSVMKAMDLDIKQYAPQAVRSFISGAKNELMEPEEYSKYASGHFQEIVVKVYKEYQRVLKESQAFDFDDLILETVKMLKSRPDILEKYQKQFRYILIDEYQDTNEAQYRLIKFLAAKHKNICAVGDDYQAIYGWRGANFKNLLDFEKDYPEAKIIKLEQNYRSTKTILEAAQKVIVKNQNRTDKELWTENVQGAPITIYQAKTGEDEAQFIATEIASLYRAGYQYNSFTILYRTNAQSRIFEDILMKFRIPYRLIGALRFYERKEIKDVLAYLRVIFNSSDEISVKRIINVPARGIGKRTQDNLKANSDHPKVRAFWELIDGLREKAFSLPVDKLIDSIVRDSGYKRFIADGTIEGEARWENIEELMNVAAGIGLVLEEGNLSHLETFLEQTALISDVDNMDNSADAVSLMTMHCAKGLEFPVVFMAGMEEGIFPHVRSLMDANELEEERRLCYVGITRAKQRLYMSYALTRIVYGGIQANLKSRFMDDIPAHLADKIEY
jgi:DNA helicase-2/ATP-dependent DNA helicase PcrA